VTEQNQRQVFWVGLLHQPVIETLCWPPCSPHPTAHYCNTQMSIRTVWITNPEKEVLSNESFAELSQPTTWYFTYVMLHSVLMRWYSMLAHACTKPKPFRICLYPCSSVELSFISRQAYSKGDVAHERQIYTVSQKKKLCQCYFLNNSVFHWTILIIFGMQHHEETLA